MSSSDRAREPMGAPPVDAMVAAVPPELLAPGSRDAAFTRAVPIADLPPGAMRRVTFRDLDVLVAHTSAGLVATDDRCPHMSAPLSLGTLSGCEVDCVLHRASFDLATGETLRFPTTGGLDPDGMYHAPWSPEGSAPKPEPAELKARARALTRTRLLRYYPVRLRDGWVELAVPA